MFRFTHCVALALAFVTWCGSARTTRAAPADLVLRNGKVVTMDDGRPAAQAVAVRGDRIVAVGDDRAVAALVGDNTRVIDLKGRLVVPGFIESHGHFMSLGRTKMMLDLTRAKTWDQIVQQVAKAAKAAPRGRWIVGRGWHQSKWTQPPSPNVQGYPTHAALSKLTPDNPVLLTHASGHAVFANARAMQLARVKRTTPDPAGGTILRDSDGEATGVFRETAQSFVQRAYSAALSRRTAQQRRDDALHAFELATENCLRHGITSFQDAGSTFADIDFFRQRADAGELKLRLWVMISESNAQLNAKLPRYRMIGAADHHLTVRAIKRIADGALGSHGAWLLEPYNDLPNSRGLSTTPPASLAQTARIAARHDVQLCVHAIGDRANREVLNVFEKTFKANPTRKDWRWRVEHAQHLHPADIPRFAKLGVIASMQGVHCTSDAPFVIQRLGEKRARQGAYAWRSLLDSGAVVVNGTDAPVEDVDPIACFYSSVTRRLPDGSTFFPKQRMTRTEALRSYTRDAAFAAFEEKLKGAITPGKLADMVVLSKDVLTVAEQQIRSTRVDLTIVGGRVLYSRAEPK